MLSFGDPNEKAGGVAIAEVEGGRAETYTAFLGQRRGFQQVNLLEDQGEQNVDTVQPYEIKTLKLPARK